MVGTKVGKEVMDIRGRAGDVVFLWNESVNYQQLQMAEWNGKIKVVQHVGLQPLH